MWKLTSITLAIITGALMFIIFPGIAILINIYFTLPVFRNIIFQSIGVTITLIGILFFLYCSNLFSKIGNGTPAPIEPPKKLVIEGIYRYTRNPIFIAYFTIMFGEFFIFGYFFLLLYIVSAILFLHFYLVYIEEPGLQKRFGDDYLTYKKNVPRWFLKKN